MLRIQMRSAGLARLAAAVMAVAALGAFISGPAGASGSPTVVTVTHSSKWGPILTLSNGDTVYRLTADRANHSVCTGPCLAAWPPVLLATGQKAPTGHGVHGLGTINRGNGERQVTYKGVPLYLFVGDHHAGQVNGNIKDTWGQWWTVNPSNPHAVPTASGTKAGNSGATNTQGSGSAY
jgi:predicted lipoprotein with Yx(FWY)xxD motif